MEPIYITPRLLHIGQQDRQRLHTLIANLIEGYCIHKDEALINREADLIVDDLLKKYSKINITKKIENAINNILEEANIEKPPTKRGRPPKE